GGAVHAGGKHVFDAGCLGQLDLGGPPPGRFLAALALAAALVMLQAIVHACRTCRTRWACGVCRGTAGAAGSWGCRAVLPWTLPCTFPARQAFLEVLHFPVELLDGVVKLRNGALLLLEGIQQLLQLLQRQLPLAG